MSDRTTRRCRQCGQPFVPDLSVKKTDGSALRRLCGPVCAEAFREAYRRTAREVMDRFGVRCAYCDHEPGAHRWHYLTLDHFVPVVLGGSLGADNCVPACRDCNTAKGDTRPEVFLADRPEVFHRLTAELRKAGNLVCA